MPSPLADLPRQDVADAVADGELLRRVGGIVDGVSIATLATEVAAVIDVPDALDAEDVSFTPAAGLSSTNVQDGLEEVAGLIAGGGYTDEQARDAVAAMIVDGEGIDTSHNDGANTLTIACEDASDTNKGIVELATTAETSTGTDTARAVTPDGLAGSVFGTESVTVEVFAHATAVTTGDGKRHFRVPTALNGMDLVSVGMGVIAKSTSGNPTVQIARGRQANATTAHAFNDMLSTALTIDANDFDSKDAGTPAAINTSNDDVLTGDLIRFDVDTAGTGTTGLFVTLGFRLP